MPVWKKLRTEEKPTSKKVECPLFFRAYTSAYAAAEPILDENYFQAGFHAFNAGTITYGGVQGTRSSWRAPNWFGEYRTRVQALKDIGIATRGDRRAFFAKEQVFFNRANTDLGSIDGWIKWEGNTVRSIVFSARARDAAGNLLPLRHPAVKGGTGMKLLGGQRTLSQNVARAFGARQLELGGTAVVHEELQQMLNRLGFERRFAYVPSLADTIDYYGRDFPVR